MSDSSYASSGSSPGGFTVGLVGAGVMAGIHLAAWQSLGVRVVVYSLDGAAELAAQVGAVEADSVGRLLDLCDAVDICTPTSTHAPLIVRAASAGRDVVCEKPVARTSAEARAAVAACASAGVRLYPAHVVRFFPEYAVMHAAVAAHTIGEIAVQRFTRTGSAPQKPWFLDETQSGGIVMDQSIHDLDFARWNAGDVSSVFARQSAASPSESSSIRSCQVVLTHTSGAISYVAGTWSRPGTTFRTTFEIAGTDGLLSHDSRAHQPLVLDGGARDESGTGLLPSTPYVESPYLTQIREFYQAFRGGPSPRVSADDGYQAVRIAEAAVESLGTRQPVVLAPTRAAE